MPLTLAFSYARDDPGWMAGTVSVDGAEPYLGSSLSTNPVRELLTAINWILECGQERRITFDLTPGGERWVLRPNGGILNVTILEFDDFDPSLPDDLTLGRVGEFSCNLIELARALEGAAAKTRADFIQHMSYRGQVFPDDELMRLRENIMLLGNK